MMSILLQKEEHYLKKLMQIHLKIYVNLNLEILLNMETIKHMEIVMYPEMVLERRLGLLKDLKP